MFLTKRNIKIINSSYDEESQADDFDDSNVFLASFIDEVIDKFISDDVEGTRTILKEEIVQEHCVKEVNIKLTTSEEETILEEETIQEEIQNTSQGETISEERTILKEDTVQEHCVKEVNIKLTTSEEETILEKETIQAEIQNTSQGETISEEIPLLKEDIVPEQHIKKVCSEERSFMEEDTGREETISAEKSISEVPDPEVTIF